MIILRTFYLFKLNDSYKSIAKRKTKSIYLLFKSIYDYDKKDILIAFDLFDEICIPINIEFINSYIFNKLKNDENYTKYRSIHMYNNYLTNEVSKMNVLKSHIKIKSNFYNNIFTNNIREIIDIFVCDFITDSYMYTSSNKLFKSKVYNYKK